MFMLSSKKVFFDVSHLFRLSDDLRDSKAKLKVIHLVAVVDGCAISAPVFESLPIIQLLDRLQLQWKIA